ncbi:unnamed protein product [Darwinula stevensoni]|uniref:VWFA domain-containing protein n=1 Tax=Darwinula stevensoni TaxID=69355 RepID=A0A7R8ZZC8_9CRUS|nr:unnamed protein product [Darwinula stevensoni]CAG0883373.1 unnamed protein product [Darwinula stevensoni]
MECSGIHPLLFLLFFFFVGLETSQYSFPTMNSPYQGSQLNDSDVNYWTLRISNQLQAFFQKVTKYEIIESNFNRGLSVDDFKHVEPFDVVKEMATDITKMMNKKIDGVKRLMDTMENKVRDAKESHMRLPTVLNYRYHNAKKLELCGNQETIYDYADDTGPRECLVLNRVEPRFGEPVNRSVSVVHVPTNVYERDYEVLEAIGWSDQLNNMFKSNAALDPSLSWQYFASASGVLRYFPAAAWMRLENAPDEFDSRLRPWYIRAATSPKEMIILIDESGSMTGQRSEIARHVVRTILETLNEDDFFNVFKFSEHTVPVLPCFNDSMAQANMENIRRFKDELPRVKTEHIANLTEALTTAFELLRKFNETGGGARCNQAIMLITDGASDNYQEIFHKYNWPYTQVRVFTYLIGKEVTDDREVKWMACANRGYFVHVRTLAEVKDQVLKYIPVLARPLVLYGDFHPIVWTNVYADIIETKVSNWLWESRQRAKQKFRAENFRRFKRFAQSNYKGYSIVTGGMEGDSKQEESHQDVEKEPVASELRNRVKESGITIPASNREDDWKKVYYEYLATGDIFGWTSHRAKRKALNISEPPEKREKQYKFLVTVSTPVFDKRERQKRTANLLGVAGIDVPIEEIQELTPRYKLGVNGYVFMVTNNGYVLFHQDHRPVYQEFILKPDYSAVDLTAVELPEEGGDFPLRNNSKLLKMRQNMVNQVSGYEKRLSVRIHLDSMRRVTVRDQSYAYYPIENTTFSLGVAWPADYGDLKFRGQVEIKLQQSRVNVTSYLTGDFNWTVHPEWVYCKYRSVTDPPFESPEIEVLHFIARTQNAGWRWLSTRVLPSNMDIVQPGDYFCDKELLQSLVFDAQATDVFRSDSHNQDSPSAGELNAVVRTFVATRSGLTRWRDYHPVHLIPNTPGVNIPGDFVTEFAENDVHWSKVNVRSVEEAWYRKAVDYNMQESEEKSVVFSVPFDAMDYKNPLVTATRTVILHNPRDPHKKTPVAVVGVQFNHSYFIRQFFMESNKCAEQSGPQALNCSHPTCMSESLDCYLLDDNGYILGSESDKHVGRFFGEVDGAILDSLIQDGVYRRVRIFDFQGVCFEVVASSGPGSILLTPLKYAYSALLWLWGHLLYVWSHASLVSILQSPSLVLSQFTNDENPFDDGHMEYGDMEHPEDEEHPGGGEHFDSKQEPLTFKWSDAI